MNVLLACGTCWFLISIWGTLQLFIMALFYKLEAVTLIEDTEAHGAEDYHQFIKKTEENYKSVARNCLIAGIFYLLLVFVSFGCIMKARINLRKEAALLEDDDIFCTPKPPPPRDERKIK